MKNCISRYCFSIVLFILIPFVFFFLLQKMDLSKYHDALYALGGLLFAIPLKLFWDAYYMPVLEIVLKPEDVTIKSILLETNEYICRANIKVSRIIIKNKGRTAAKNCKGWLSYKNSQGKDVQVRVCWTVPKERPTATINVNDMERLDFCGYRIDVCFESLVEGVRLPNMEKRLLFLAPTEDSWEKPRDFTCLLQNQRFGVVITSENTKSISAKIHLLTNEKSIQIDN